MSIESPVLPLSTEARHLLSLGSSPVNDSLSRTPSGSSIPDTSPSVAPYSARYFADESDSSMTCTPSAIAARKLNRESRKDEKDSSATFTLSAIAARKLNREPRKEVADSSSAMPIWMDVVEDIRPGGDRSAHREPLEQTRKDSKYAKGLSSPIARVLNPDVLQEMDKAAVVATTAGVLSATEKCELLRWLKSDSVINVPQLLVSVYTRIQDIMHHSKIDRMKPGNITSDGSLFNAERAFCCAKHLCSHDCIRCRHGLKIYCIH
jgi:hypothetical protein